MGKQSLAAVFGHPQRDRSGPGISGLLMLGFSHQFAGLFEALVKAGQFGIPGKLLADLAGFRRWQFAQYEGGQPRLAVIRRIRGHRWVHGAIPFLASSSPIVFKA